MFNHCSYLLQIEHYLQIVKTEVVARRSSREYKLLEEYEYTAHSSLVQSVYIPVAKFHFELSPMQVKILLLSLLSYYYVKRKNKVICFRCFSIFCSYLLCLILLSAIRS